MHFKGKLFQSFSIILKISFWITLSGVCLLTTSSCDDKKQKKLQSVKVGILCSLTGPMSMQEKPITEAILLAIEEINLKGGLLGHQLSPAIFDTASDPEKYPKGAIELIEQEKVVVIFGGGNSVSRRNTRAVIEEHEGLLVFPMHYEGGKRSPRIIYVGPAPNQQLIPAVHWAFQNIGSRFFLVGTDSIYSHVANAIIKDFIYALNAEVIGESYISVDNTMGLNAIIERIDASRPDVILNTIEGPGNLAFFELLRETHPTSVPTISFSLTENLLRQLSRVHFDKDYAIWGYFQSLDNKKNNNFEQAFHSKYGKGRAIDDPMESSYVGVYLWSQAVTDANSFNPNSVLRNIPNQSYAAPSGLIYIDRETQSAYRPVRIGIVSEQQFKIVWDSEASIMPVQYTLFRTPQEWDELIQEFYEKWGRQWFRGKE